MREREAENTESEFFLFFTQRGCRDVQAFAVFGNGSAGDFDTVAGQNFCDFIVGKDVIGRFLVNQIFDFVFDAQGRNGVFSAIVSHGCSEKVFELKIPKGVCTYLLVVTRLTVLSCISTASAIVFRVSGFR